MVFNLGDSFVVEARLTKRDVQGVPSFCLATPAFESGMIVNHGVHGV